MLLRLKEIQEIISPYFVVWPKVKKIYSLELKKENSQNIRIWDFDENKLSLHLN